MSGRHIVMATVGSQGDLFPFLAVGRELRARGYRVTIGAHGIHRDAVLEAGLDFVLASGIAEPEDKAAFAARAFHPWRGPRFVVRDLAAAHVASSYAALAPVCVDADASREELVKIFESQKVTDLPNRSRYSKLRRATPWVRHLTTSITITPALK